MKLTFKLTRDKLPGMNTAHTRRHWAVAHKEARNWRDWIWWALRGAGLKTSQMPLQNVSVVLTRHSQKEPDFDNMVYSWKPVVDALVSNDIIEDDAPKYLKREYRWEFAKARHGHVTIKITGEAIDHAKSKPEDPRPSTQ